MREIYSERLDGIGSEKRNTLTMTRRLLEKDPDLSWSLELDGLERAIERYDVRRLSARYWTISGLSR